MNKKLLLVQTLALFLTLPNIALAQDDVEVELVEEVDSSSTAAQLDPDDPLYWAKMRDVYTYQKKGHRKDGRFAVSLYTGIIPNNIFEQYIPVGLRLDYYILENLGIEVASSYAIKISTSLSDTLKDKSGLGATGILLGDSQVSHTNVGVIWSPLYGKSSFYEATINYFDVYLYGGVGLAIVQTQEDFGKTTPATELKVEGAIGAGVNFFLTDHAHLRLDYRQFVFKKVGGGVANPSEASLAFGWMF